MISKHYTVDRANRDYIIRTEIGYGETVREYTIDKGHWHGTERHVLSNTGIITIYAIRTGDLITRLIARPAQVRKFYKENEIVPEDILNLAYEHQRKGYNEVK